MDRQGAHFLEPKQDKFRDIAVLDDAAGYPLWDMLLERAKEVGDTGVMFATPKGGLWRRSNFARVMRPLREETWGGRRWTFHALRHHYCRWLLDSGFPATDVAETAGHADTTVTLRLYVSKNEGTAQLVLQRLNGQGSSSGGGSTSDEEGD